jgi:hypothetical protein
MPMPIFGQVWLWSSLAFLLGALLCWSLVALPARRRVSELEAELTARTRRQPPNDPRRPVEDEREDYDPRRLRTGHDQESQDRPPGPLTRAYAQSGTRGDASSPIGVRHGLEAPAETDTELSDGPGSSSTQYLDVAGSSKLEAPSEAPSRQGDRGWFDDKERRGEDSPAVTTVLPQVPAEPVDSRLVDDDVEGPEDGGTVFTQRTHPIPGELIRQLDDSTPEAPEPRLESRSEPAHALVDDIEDIEDEEEAAGILAEPAATGESKHQLTEASAVTSTLTPAVEPLEAGPAHGAHDRTEVVPAHTAEDEREAVSESGRHGAVREHSTPGTEEPKNMPGVTVQAEPTKSKLPKRVPSKPPTRTPFGVQTTSPATPMGNAESASDSSRALFEPIVPAGDGPAVPPPPHRMRGVANGRGPFGAGSAMPLPGGGAPSPEYTVKASASAMRYCTPESEKFERTVAEVWFRSASDAERVGFRPLG